MTALLVVVGITSGVSLLQWEQYIDGLFVSHSVYGQKLRQISVGVGSDNHIDCPVFVEYLSLHSLCNTTQKSYLFDFSSILQFWQIVQFVPDLSLGVLSDGTRHQQYYISLWLTISQCWSDVHWVHYSIQLVDQSVAVLRENSFGQLCVVDIHLTSIGLNED